MKYVLTGGAGHITKPLAETLLATGHDVTVIGRSADNLKDLTAKGATPAVGSVEDRNFLTQTFIGADAVYTMVPPNFAVTEWKSWIGGIGRNYAEAIKAAGVKNVVNLSSVGAHRSKGVGPVNGLNLSEQALNELSGVNIKHLRPGFFYTNFFSNIPMIKGMNLLGGNYGGAETKMALVHPTDIAAVAAEELQSLNFTGHSIRYIASEETTTGEVSKALGSAIGKENLPWVEFTDEQAFGGLQQAGLPPEIAKNYTEMGAAIRSGIIFEEYWNNRPAELGKTKLPDFAKEFAEAYNAG